MAAFVLFRADWWYNLRHRDDLRRNSLQAEQVEDQSLTVQQLFNPVAMVLVVAGEDAPPNTTSTR
jgi:hypothetical protein